MAVGKESIMRATNANKAAEATTAVVGNPAPETVEAAAPKATESKATPKKTTTTRTKRTSASKTKTEKKTTQKKTETKPAEKSTSAIKSDLPVYLL